MIFSLKTRCEARKRFKKNRLRVICVPLRARKRVRFSDPCLLQPAILQETSSLTGKKERKSFSEMINKNHFSGKNPFRGRNETRKRSKSDHLKPAASPETGSRGNGSKKGAARRQHHQYLMPLHGRVPDTAGHFSADRESHPGYPPPGRQRH